MPDLATPTEEPKPNESPSLLRAESLATGYGKKQVLNGVSLSLMQREVVAMVGHNGAGKSTLLKVLFGLIPLWEGRIFLDGRFLQSVNPRELLRAGMVYVPQGNRVFTDLTVHENLKIAGITLGNGRRLDCGMERALSLFPPLKPRLRQRAGTLSGGEKQMLALAKALVLSPRVLLLDEPSLGLAPPLVSDSLGRIQHISRDSGVAVLIVEQKVREVLRIAQRVYVLRNGQVSFEGLTTTLDDQQLRQAYF